MTVGTELKQAREHAGLSPEQISERTKIQLYKVDSLENGTFELLPQGIYLDGIVRAYAREVGIDPEPMVERVRLERGKLPGDSEIPFAAPIDLRGTSATQNVQTIDVPDEDDSLNSFAAESTVAAVPIARPATHAPQISHALDLPLSPQVTHAPATHTPARPARGRARVVLPVLAMLSAAFLGGYLFTSNRVLDGDVTAESAPRPANPTDMAMGDAGAASREGRSNDLPVPFSENTIENTTSPEKAPKTAPRQARPVPEAARSAAPPSRPVESPAASAASARPESIGTAGSVKNVSGSWNLATQTESTNYSRYKGLTLGYELKLQQDGDRVTGAGRKVNENGTRIRPRAQTPLTVSGTISGDRLTLTFVERGARRATQGKFVLLVDERGTLRGRFSSNSAQSSGRVEGHRVSTQ